MCHEPLGDLIFLLLSPLTPFLFIHYSKYFHLIYPTMFTSNYFDLPILISFFMGYDPLPFMN